MVMRQLALPISQVNQPEPRGTYLERLVTLLNHNLDFHAQDSGYASHNLHSFPAKFPPQLPRKFIMELTGPGDTVLDPMVGSGTTVLEALLAERQGLGFDIDPLALLISTVKCTTLDKGLIAQWGNEILKQSTFAVRRKKDELEQELRRRWDSKTRQFVNYWFAPEVQIELLALINEIEKIADTAIKSFFKMAFSAIIITKSSGVSLAIDIAHTRPHRAKIVLDKAGEVIWKRDSSSISPDRIKYLTKTIRSPLKEFQRQLKRSVKNLLGPNSARIPPSISFGDAQRLPLEDDVIDLMVTSPPYPANAIDYMRAHKFSLVWMGYPINDLGRKRGEYIGGEATMKVDFEDLPNYTSEVVTEIADCDEKKGQVLHRYYSEMTRTLQEMFRVLKPGKAVILVVGSSTMRGKDTQTPECLADIGQSIGFEVPRIGVRHLDRNRRMMPTGSEPDLRSQIQQRMHEEYVIGFYKPK